MWKAKYVLLRGKRKQITESVQLVTNLHPSVEFVTVIPQLSASHAMKKCLSNVTLNVTLSSNPYSTTDFLVGKTSLLKRCTWSVSWRMNCSLFSVQATLHRYPQPRQCRCPLSTPLKSKGIMIQPCNHLVMWREQWHCATLLHQTQMNLYQKRPSGRAAARPADPPLPLFLLIPVLQLSNRWG